WWLSLRGKGAPIADQRQGALRRVLRIVEPEFDLRGVRIEPRRMRRLGGDVIPLTGAVAVFLAVQRENQLSLGDDPHVLGLMMMKAIAVPAGYDANRTSQPFAGSLNAWNGPSNFGSRRIRWGKGTRILPSVSLPIAPSGCGRWPRYGGARNRCG